jgi:DNA-binding transcriptional LysR family regulator
MRIDRLHYLAAVNQFGSLRRASQHLHLSQAALSEALAKLEKDLGVTLLDRRRTGARISRQGRDLLPHMNEVLDAVERLRQAADDQRRTSRLVRIGTVNTATTQLLIPSLRALQESHPETTVEVLDMLQADIEIGLQEGTLDLGLVNLLEGDDVPISARSTVLRRGRPVVVLPSAHPYVDLPAVSVDELRAEPFISMRSGYVMHRVAHRLFGSDLPARCRSTEGAEMGKLMVAEGLGLTVLPDFSVVADPLERAGAITVRPLADPAPAVHLTLLTRRDEHTADQVDALAATLVRQARAWVPPACPDQAIG